MAQEPPQLDAPLQIIKKDTNVDNKSAELEWDQHEVISALSVKVL